MRRTYWPVMVSAVAGSLLMLGMTACSDTFSTSSGTVLSTQETSDIADADADDVDEAMVSITSEGAAFSVASGRSAVAFSGPPGGGCATVDNTTDTDGDGVPDNATFTFALPACSHTGFRGGTLERTGTVNISDPTPDVEGFGFLATLADFQSKMTAPLANHSFTATRDGTRSLTGDATGISLTNNITLVRSVPNRTDATIVHDFVISFTPAEGETFALGLPLPNGTFTKEGTLSFTRGNLTRSFTFTTVVPLVWDASCTTDRKIVAGEIHATMTEGGYIKTVWTGCGIDPTRTFVRATTPAA